MRKMLLMACVFCFGVLPALSDTSWKSDVYSGSWTNAANWTDGVPDASKIASIENSGADYTVTIDSDATLYATNTIVGMRTD